MGSLRNIMPSGLGVDGALVIRNLGGIKATLLKGFTPVASRPLGEGLGALEGSGGDDGWDG